MGSIGTYAPKGTPTKQIVEDVTGSKMLASAMKGGVFYGVFESALDGSKVAFVSPISRYKGETVVKLQDETMGPYDTRCPDRLLDMLDPTESAYANEWRAKCREHNAAERAAKQAAKLVKAGSVIRFASPLFFGQRYGSADTFRYSGTGSTFSMVGGDNAGLPVRLTNWKTRTFEVLS